MRVTCLALQFVPGSLALGSGDGCDSDRLCSHVTLPAPCAGSRGVGGLPLGGFGAGLVLFSGRQGAQPL